MAPKAKPDQMAGGPSSSKCATDPMLQGTYEQDESNDLEASTDEIAAFEERLQQQQQHGRGNSAAARNVSRTPTSGAPRRSLAPLANSAHRPHPSSTPAPSAAAGASYAASHRTADRGVSEDEHAAQAQRGEDIEDVRRLEDRFRGGDDGDSDEETVARRRKMGL
ncbi:conserved hypothetical protein [Leishmania mexicana MHOM/GT/2001/U1103]|uniref:Uncharacterized protein n=1 Tax=Leishmania mexicana (strain MHOM/GT/2001/U1103) TaxID=929439 RepID=E9AZX1_LEIMU|nr:conserved hypothetical protein [Leishmania mexicana MHOM/GT/2001/U1103]CBZ28522.1 conserved hypothetical protein [Leishmania mexicana MHOM/GT/2001/U1103]